MIKHKWTQQEDSLLKEFVNIGKFNFKQMAPFFPLRTPNSLQLRSRFLGLESKYKFFIYTFDETFFDKPNLINCFWAGWLSADGNLYKYAQELYSLNWRMHHKDEYFMTLFKKHIKYTGSITHTKSYGYNGEREDFEIHSFLKISRIDLGKHHLAKFGITPNKTKRLPGPILEKIEYKLAYLIGYINGDGCINFHLNKKNKGQISISFTSSSKLILEWILELVNSLKLPKIKIFKKTIVKSKRGNCMNLSFSGLQAIYLFELLNLCPVPILERKWKQPKILDYISNLKQSHPQWFNETIDYVMKRNNIDFSKFSHAYPLKLEEIPIISN